MQKSAFYFADFGRSQGTGHLSRLYILSEQLRDFKNIFFIEKDGLPLASELFPKLEFRAVNSLNQVAEQLKLEKQSPEFFFLDSYQNTQPQEKVLRNLAKKLVVIDDLANRKHESHFLIDTTYGRQAKEYKSLLPPDCKMLLGTDFCFIKENFTKSRPAKLPAFTNKLHVFFGGSDEANYTQKFLNVALEQISDWHFNVVVTKAYQFSAELKVALKNYKNVTLFIAPEDFAKTFRDCSVAVGAPGISTWERACLGIPGFYIATAPTQIEILQKLEQQNFCKFLGSAQNADWSQIVSSLKSELKNLSLIENLRKTCFEAVDGKGLERILIELGVES